MKSFIFLSAMWLFVRLIQEMFSTRNFDIPQFYNISQKVSPPSAKICAISVQKILLTLLYVRGNQSANPYDQIIKSKAV